MNRVFVHKWIKGLPDFPYRFRDIFEYAASNEHKARPSPKSVTFRVMQSSGVTVLFKRIIQRNNRVFHIEHAL